MPALLALPLTIALLFLMTRLILPGDRDPVVQRMIQDIEFLRTPLPPEEILVFELPPPPEPEPEPEPVDELLSDTTDTETPTEDDAPADPPVAIDWWAAVSSIADEEDEEALERWLLEQGYEKYVSIMQGDLPITNPADGNLQPTQGDKTGYLNIYGDLEFKVSENCVIQTQVSARLDISDFSQKLPMRVMCKKPTRKIYDFERD